MDTKINTKYKQFDGANKYSCMLINNTPGNKPNPPSYAIQLLIKVTVDSLSTPDQSSRKVDMAQAQYTNRKSLSLPYEVALNDPSGCCIANRTTFKILKIIYESIHFLFKTYDGNTQ